MHAVHVVSTDARCERRSRHLRQGVDHRLGTAHEAEALLDVSDRGSRAELGRRGGAAVFEQDAAAAQEVGVLERAHHALIGVHSGEEQGADVEVPQDAVERRVPEAADSILVDAVVTRLALERATGLRWLLRRETSRSEDDSRPE